MSPGRTKAMRTGILSALCRSGTAPFRVFKLGLVDGENPSGMMLGGYYILHGALHQTLPEKQSYPRREQGNVLVHCRGGRSRSIALVALYLHLQDPIRFPELDDAIALVREKREVHPEEWFKAPKQAPHRCRGRGGAGHPIAARPWRPCSLRTPHWSFLRDSLPS